jgi:hypothetical protein
VSLTRGASLPGYEIGSNGIEASGLLSAGQFSIESQPVKGRLCVCCSTVISGA